MKPPQYVIRRTAISVICDTPEACALAELAKRMDCNGRKESAWWGHPDLVGMPDGTVLLKIPLNVRNIALLHEYGARPSSDDPETVRRLSFFRNKPVEFKTDFPLKPFQNEGAVRLLAHDLRMVLAFDAGLGKSLTSIAVLLSNPTKYLPAIIMAPAHVKLNWGSEWEKWGGSPDKIAVLFGRTPDLAEVSGKQLVVLNHHILAGWVDTLIAVNPKTMIVDEAHDFVNSGTKTYPIVERLAKACQGRVMLLTATPLVNNLSDLWSLCNLVDSDIIGTKKVFEDTFMPEEKAKSRLFASRWKGGFQKADWKHVAMARLPKPLMARRIEELKDLLHRTIMLRKRKSEVIDQLPAITETMLRIEIPRDTDEGRDFWFIEEKCELAIADGKEDILASSQLLSAYTKAKSNAATAKVPYAVDWIRDFLLETEDTEKLVVVGWSVEPLQKLCEAFKKQALLVNGEMDAKKKFAAGLRFGSDPTKRVLFGNERSIGTGIDQLVVASTMLFLELPMSSKSLEQLKGRIDRMSKEAQALRYCYMTVKGSIEEKKGWQQIRRKEKLTKDLGL